MDKKPHRNIKYTTDEVITKFRVMHGDRYDYSEVEYVNRDSPVTIICRTHGRFEQCAHNHWSGCQCPKCGAEASHQRYQLGRDEFVRRAKLKHGDKYDYSQVKYYNNRTKVIILCPKHGAFTQMPNMHLSGRGCPSCKAEKQRTGCCRYGVMDIIEGHTLSESRWRGMMGRCYGAQHTKAYDGCEVCDEWKTYSNFKRWFDNHYVKGYHLDKDILVKGNKIYSPDTCCFVPQRINSLLIRPHTKMHKYKPGVCKHYDKFQAQMQTLDGHVFIGTFETEDEAFYAYKNAKESYIKEVARDYYSRGAITENVYNALMNWNIEPTD